MLILMVEEGGKGTNSKKNGGAWEHRAILQGNKEPPERPSVC